MQSTIARAAHIISAKLVAIALVLALLCGCSSGEIFPNSKVMIVTLPKKWLIGEYFECTAPFATLQCEVAGVEQDIHTLKVNFHQYGDEVTDQDIHAKIWQCQILQDQDSKEYSLDCWPKNRSGAQSSLDRKPLRPDSRVSGTV